MFNLNNANMENLITQINKERLVNSDTALMMKEYTITCLVSIGMTNRIGYAPILREGIPRCICASARHWQHVSNG